jgi:uncharacterized protein (DUF1697 family)
MPRLFAFLRAINVGGHTVTMEELRRQFSTLGLREVETFIASGNVIFSSRATAIPALQCRIEARLESALGYPVPTFIRTEAQLVALHGHRPFPAGEQDAAHALMIGLIAEPLPAAAARKLVALGGAADRFHVNGREIYWLRKTREGDPTLTNARLERVLGTPATFRNRNTFARLVDRYELGAY